MGLMPHARRGIDILAIMPDLLADPPLLLIVFAAVLLLITGAVWFRSRTQRSLFAFLVALLLVVLLVLLDFGFESAREQAKRKLLAMRDAANARRWADVSTHVSTKFQYSGMNKASFETFVNRTATQANATVAFNGFSKDDYEKLPDGRIRIGFNARVESQGQQAAVYVIAFFALEGDEWRMVTFQVKDYVQREGPEIRMPGQ
jgi:cell division protein FtsW (lipid II flippase)